MIRILLSCFLFIPLLGWGQNEDGLVEEMWNKPPKGWIGEYVYRDSLTQDSTIKPLSGQALVKYKIDSIDDVPELNPSTSAADSIVKQRIGEEKYNEWRSGSTQYSNDTLVMYHFLIPEFGTRSLRLEFDTESNYKSKIAKWLPDCINKPEDCEFISRIEACQMAKSVCPVIKDEKECEGHLSRGLYDRKKRRFYYVFSFGTSSKEIDYGKTKEIITAMVWIDANTGKVIQKECKVEKRER